MKNRSFTKPFGWLVPAWILCGITLLPAVSPAEQSVHLKAHNGQYVVAEEGGGGEVKADRDAAGEWETFTLIDVNGGSLAAGDRVHLRTSDGSHYLVAEDGGGREVKADRIAAGAWETFTIVKTGGSGEILDGDAVALQADNGAYVVAEEGGGREVKADRQAIGEWETFTLEIIDPPDAVAALRAVDRNEGELPSVLAEPPQFVPETPQLDPAGTLAHVVESPYRAATLVRAEVNAARLAAPARPGPLPRRVFLSSLVTPLGERQGQRRTCMAFTVVALMESAIKEETGRSVNLSEQWLHFIQKTTFLEQRALPLAENQYGRSGGSNLQWNLGRSVDYGVPVEEEWPYQAPAGYEDVRWENARAETVDRNNLLWTMPKHVLAAPRYRTGDFVFIREVPEPDVLRPQLEMILASGRPVGIGLNINPHRSVDNVLRPVDGGDVSGAHGVVLYGYDRDRQYFIAKNSWGEGTNPPGDDLQGLWALSYDFVGRIFELGYIESVRPASLAEDRALRYLGWWKLSWDGWKGNLAINRLPDRQDRRVGDLYTRSGETYRVNGRLNPDGSLSLCLDFRDPNIDTYADVCDRFRFDLQIADDDPDWMMGTHYSYEAARSFGAYGTRGQFPRGDHAAAGPDGMRGEWELIDGGGTARLSVDRVAADGSFEGHCAVDGRSAPVRGRYDWNGGESQPGAVSFLVELPSDTRRYLGYHHSRERNVIAGLAIGRPEGFVLNKTLDPR